MTEAYADWSHIGRVYAKNSKSAMVKAKTSFGGRYVIEGVKLSRNAPELFKPNKEFDVFGHLRMKYYARGER